MSKDIDSNKLIPCKIGQIIKSKMNKQNISIRQLSKYSNISASTISRIISGKQTATVEHLKIFSDKLNIPIELLLESMGVSNLKQSLDNNYDNVWIKSFQEVVDDFPINFDSIISDIIKELNKLEEYAKTHDGENFILNNFEDKIKNINSLGPTINKLNHYYKLFCSSKISDTKKSIIGSALLYFIWTAEVIPDYLYPIGHLDDALALNLTEKKLSQMED